MNKEDRKDLVERLRNVTEDDAYALPWTFGETCREAADEIDRLRRELKQARNALEPFADQAELWSGQVSDRTPLLEKDNLTVGDVRRAATALRAGEPPR